jgi:hypothetical protein
MGSRQRNNQPLCFENLHDPTPPSALPPACLQLGMGYVLPVLVQLVLDFEARRAFVRRHATQLNNADRARWLGWVPASLLPCLLLSLPAIYQCSRWGCRGFTSGSRLPHMSAGHLTVCPGMPAVALLRPPLAAAESCRVRLRPLGWLSLCTSTSKPPSGTSSCTPRCTCLAGQTWRRGTQPAWEPRQPPPSRRSQPASAGRVPARRQRWCP